MGRSGLAGAMILYCLLWVVDQGFYSLMLTKYSCESKISCLAYFIYRIFRRAKQIKLNSINACLLVPIRAFVGGKDSNLSPRHFLFVYGDCLRYVVDLRLHFPDLRRLQIQHLQKVVRQGVDLVGHTGQALRRVAFGFFQSGSFVVALNINMLNKQRYLKGFCH